jgi:hypothetical protein
MNDEKDEEVLVGVLLTMLGTEGLKGPTTRLCLLQLVTTSDDVTSPFSL